MDGKGGFGPKQTATIGCCPKHSARDKLGTPPTRRLEVPLSGKGDLCLEVKSSFGPHMARNSTNRHKLSVLQAVSDPWLDRFGAFCASRAYALLFHGTYKAAVRARTEKPQKKGAFQVC